MIREEWLNKMVKKLNPLFTEAGYQLPQNVKVSCGFPSKGIKSKVIGECWDLEQSEDNQYEIFVHPNQNDSVKVAGILVHELVHTVVGVKEKHNANFKSCALKVGLCGKKMKATEESPELIGKLEEIIKEIGVYPHGKLIPKGREVAKNPSTVKVVCPDCEYTVRTSKKWIARGLPTCCCGKEMEAEDLVEVGEEND